MLGRPKAHFCFRQAERGDGMAACILTPEKHTVIICVNYAEAYEWCVENSWTYVDANGCPHPVHIVERAYQY